MIYDLRSFVTKLEHCTSYNTTYMTIRLCDTMKWFSYHTKLNDEWSWLLMKKSELIINKTIDVNFY